MKKNVRQSVKALCAAAVCIALAAAFFTGCEISKGWSHENELIEFKFEAAKNKNAKLLKTVVGEIDNNTKTVTVTVPSDADRTKLKASFTSSRLAQVSVGGEVQQSGNTMRDFTAPVLYTVKAENGSEQTYTVKTVVGKAARNLITAFDFKKSVNDALSADAVCLMGGYLGQKGLIFVKFPVGTTESTIRSLKPTFTASDMAKVFLGKTSGGPELESDTTSADFYNLKEGIDITVKAEDGDERPYNVAVEIDLPNLSDGEINKYAGSYYGVLKSQALGENKVIIVLEKEKVTLYTTAQGMSMDYVNVEWEKDDDTCTCTAYSKKDKTKLRIKNRYGRLGFSFYKKDGKIKTDTAIMGTPMTAEKGKDFVWEPGCGYDLVSMHL